MLTPPSPQHWFGTGKLGEDLFAQSMHGLQKSLLIGLLVAVLSTALAPWSEPSPATSAGRPTAG